MKRRDFLKIAAGGALALGVANTALPYPTKSKLISPFTKVLDETFYNRLLKTKIARFKKENPNLKLGDTHCHSVFSDGNFTVQEILSRCQLLGLDFIVITEHWTPRRYPLSDSMDSFAERQRLLDSRHFKRNKPFKVYPGFEISTRQGHLILVFPEEYLKPAKRREIQLQFTPHEKDWDDLEVFGRLIKKFGGISIIPHPNIVQSFPFGVPTSFIKYYLSGLVDGVEDINSGHGYFTDYSGQLNLASIGASDDHFNLTIGSGLTAFDSTLYKDFLTAVKHRGTRAVKIDDSLAPYIQAARVLI